MEAWHGSTEVNIRNIKKNGFNFPVYNLENSTYLPGDLGAGVYFFVDLYGQSGEIMARKFAECYRDKIAKRQKCRIAVLKIDIDENRWNILDLDEVDNKRIWFEFLKAHETKFQELKNRVKISSTRKRINYDGILIELFISKIKENNKNIDIVMKETSTAIKKEISNFPNGKECCVRNSSVLCVNSRGELKYENKFERFLRCK